MHTFLLVVCAAVGQVTPEQAQYLRRFEPAQVRYGEIGLSMDAKHFSDGDTVTFVITDTSTETLALINGGPPLEVRKTTSRPREVTYYVVRHDGLPWVLSGSEFQRFSRLAHGPLGLTVHTWWQAAGCLLIPWLITLCMIGLGCGFIFTGVGVRVAGHSLSCVAVFASSMMTDLPGTAWWPPMTATLITYFLGILLAYRMRGRFRETALDEIIPERYDPASTNSAC